MTLFFFFNDTATTEIYTLSLHDALPIFVRGTQHTDKRTVFAGALTCQSIPLLVAPPIEKRKTELRNIVMVLWLQTLVAVRSEEHTSELQSRQYLVCRLLLEKKKTSCLLR